MLHTSVRGASDGIVASAISLLLKVALRRRKVVHRRYGEGTIVDAEELREALNAEGRPVARLEEEARVVEVWLPGCGDSLVFLSTDRQREGTLQVVTTGI